MNAFEPLSSDRAIISMFEQYGQNVNMAFAALLPGLSPAQDPSREKPELMERSTFQIDTEKKPKNKKILKSFTRARDGRNARVTKSSALSNYALSAFRLRT